MASKITDSYTKDSAEEIKHLQSQLSIARSEISNLRQQLKSLKHTYRKDCEDIEQKLQNWQCFQCKNRQISENAACSSSTNTTKNNLPLQYIGMINTQFPEKRGTPRQPGICSDMVAKLTLNNDIFTNPEHALEGLQEFSHIWILFHFHKHGATHTRAKVTPPRLNGLRTGVFATRSPHRPCPIGLSLVKIDRIMDNTIYFSGVDMIDQTPVLDIKPYIPQYDNPSLSLPVAMHFNSAAQDVAVPDSIEHAANVLVNGSRNNHVVDVSHLHINNSNIRVMDGEENIERSQAVVGASSTVQQNFSTTLEESYHDSRSASRIGEREAPDGEEEETPRQAPAANDQSTPVTPQRQVRIASWIDQPPVSTLNVEFKERALLQLRQLGNEGKKKKVLITNVLREDPRSIYLREQVESSGYVFRIAELYVSCRFDDSAHVVTVYQIFQDFVAQSDE